ncbi:hypothetical protein [Gordonia jacobaea]|uniref:hypothetical protein n=1 Tax=Gordonia jacobaea TaxID=122202 RepID=UPI003D72B879
MVTLVPESSGHDAAHGAAPSTDANSIVAQQQSSDGSTWWKVITVVSLVIAAAAVLAVASLWRRLGGDITPGSASANAPEDSDGADSAAETDTAEHASVGSTATADIGERRRPGWARDADRRNTCTTP